MKTDGKNKGKNPDTVLCLEDSSFWKVVFSDIIQLDNIIVISPQVRWKGIKSRAVRTICRAHHSFRLNSIIEIPFKNIWNRYDYVYRLEDSVKRWIFTDTSIRGYSRAFIERLKTKGVRLHILFLNPVVSSYETNYAMKLVRQGYFELVYTVDRGDAEKYGFIYTNAVYSKKEIMPDDNRWKIFYIGIAKNRLHELHSIAEFFQETKSIFYISGVPETEKKALNNVVYNHPMNYEDVLQVVAKSDCILEVLQPGQKGFTFRTYEALCYDKKLITNNQDIKNQSFYDSKFIKVYTNIDSSFLEFISNGEMPNYNYKGEYSPIKLYKDMLLREKNDSAK